MIKKTIEYPTSLKKMQKFMLVDEGKMYSIMLKHFLPAIVGNVDWRVKSREIVMSAFVTASDEAFCLLCLENAWDHWNDLSEGKEAKDKFDKQNRDLVKQGLEPQSDENLARSCLYTSGGSGLKESQGWNQEGIDRFNHLLDTIRTARASENGKVYYQNFLMDMQDAASKKRSRKRKEREEAQVVALTDFGPAPVATQASLEAKGYDVTVVDGYLCYKDPSLGVDVRIKVTAMVGV